MGLLDSILSAVSGKSDASGEAAPLIGVLSGLLAQSGGLQGLANKFSQTARGTHSHHGSAWAKTRPVSTNQIQQALGSDQVRALAAKNGSGSRSCRRQFLAEYLPKIVDKLTPPGKWIPPRTISKDWRLYCHPSCKALAETMAMVSPRKRRRFGCKRADQGCITRGSRASVCAIAAT